MRRIPANAEPYRRWPDAWADLSAQDHPDLKAVAQRHGVSKRQIEFIRRAGQAGLLDSPVPPAALLAALARTGTWRSPNHTADPAGLVTTVRP